MNHWPFWLGGLALASTGLGYWLAERRTFGVSGMLARVVRRIQGERDLVVDADLEAQLLALTEAQFGAAAMTASESTPPSAPSNSSVPWSAQATFLVMLAVGGLLASLLRGGLALQTSLGPDFEHLIGRGPTAIAILFVGGICTGFGTRMAGGCTSGHGLTGCGRLQIPSLLATAVFFGTGIAVSLALSWSAR